MAAQLPGFLDIKRGIAGKMQDQVPNEQKIRETGQHHVRGPRKLTHARWQLAERLQVCQRRHQQPRGQAAGHPLLQLRNHAIRQQLECLGCIVLVAP